MGRRRWISNPHKTYKNCLLTFVTGLTGVRWVMTACALSKVLNGHSYACTYKPATGAYSMLTTGGDRSPEPCRSGDSRIGLRGAARREGRARHPDADHAAARGGGYMVEPRLPGRRCSQLRLSLAVIATRELARCSTLAWQAETCVQKPSSRLVGSPQVLLRRRPRLTSSSFNGRTRCRERTSDLVDWTSIVADTREARRPPRRPDRADRSRRDRHADSNPRCPAPAQPPRTPICPGGRPRRRARLLDGRDHGGRGAGARGHRGRVRTIEGTPDRDQRRPDGAHAGNCAAAIRCREPLRSCANIDCRRAPPK